MNNRILAVLVGAVILLTGSCVFAAGTNNPTAELKTLVAKVKFDIQSGKTTESALGDDLEQFDVLLAEHKGEKTDAVAEILLMKARLYSEVFQNTAKADELMKQLKSEFQGTRIVAELEQQETMEAAAKKIQDSLVVGAKFPDFSETDVDDKPLALTDHKGKVVLIDFWATWCPPCRAEIPNVVATYKKYHAEGFDIIGVSLDQDREKLLGYTSQNEMTWPQFFDGQGWGNKLAVKYGIESIPATYLLDGNGVIIAKDVRGEALEPAVAKALTGK
ncbi:MAG: TlpA disulfide reductase family protein [Verrucomicrobiota bacterium]|jgi:thiol-disulfide isomerase/thioredoxin